MPATTRAAAVAASPKLVTTAAFAPKEAVAKTSSPTPTSSGTSFSPRIHPRPAYPPFSKVAQKWAAVLAKDAIFGIALTLSLYAPYVRFASLWSERVCYALTIVIAHTGTYLLYNGTVTILEAVQWQPLLNCKISRKAHEVPTRPLVTKLLIAAAINHLVTSPLTSYYLFKAVKDQLGMPAPSAPLPSVAMMALLFVCAHTVNDFGFYWTHRLFHTKLLYATFHKQHHTFKGTVGAAAEFAGPVETIVSNQLPTIGLMVFTGQHPLLQGVWIVLRLLQTYDAHSGYDFSETALGRIGILATDGGHHDHHHTANTGNFGAEHTDWLFGTMDHWMAHGGSEGYLRKRRSV